MLVTLFAPVVAEFAVTLGPPEYFMLMVLAFTTVSAVLGKSTVRGLAALFIGLAVGLIGMDQISGQPRYTGGQPEFLDGIEIVLVAVGLFAVAEVLHAALFEGKIVETQNRLTRVHMSARAGPHTLAAAPAAGGHPDTAGADRRLQHLEPVPRGAGRAQHRLRPHAAGLGQEPGRIA